MKLILTAISGSREGEIFTIEPNECVTFGRENASRWSFQDDIAMSTVHFEVANLGIQAELRDRGSKNGTWLNSEKVAIATLRDGDRILAGRTMFTVETSQDFVPAFSVEESEVEQTQAPTPVEEIEIEAFDQFDAQYVTPAKASDFREKPGENQFEALPAVDGAGKKRKNNPFDSVDFEELEILLARARKNASSLPITEEIEPGSNAVFSSRPPSTPHSAGSNASPKAKFELLSRRTTADAAESFTIILDSLKSRWSVQMVVHFQKVRIATLNECDSKPIVRGMTDPIVSNYLPVRLAWNDANSSVVIPLLPRLCRSDACMAFLGRSALEIGSQLEAISSMGIEGFSEPDGFLPFFWPSSLISIVEARGKSVCDRLFGSSISGVLFCTPYSRNEIFAVADGSLDQDLSAAEFRQIERLLPNR